MRKHTHTHVQTHSAVALIQQTKTKNTKKSHNCMLSALFFFFLFFFAWKQTKLDWIKHKKANFFVCFIFMCIHISRFFPIANASILAKIALPSRPCIDFCFVFFFESCCKRKKCIESHIKQFNFRFIHPFIRMNSLNFFIVSIFCWIQALTSFLLYCLFVCCCFTVLVCCLNVELIVTGE